MGLFDGMKTSNELFYCEGELTDHDRKKMFESLLKIAQEWGYKQTGEGLDIKHKNVFHTRHRVMLEGNGYLEFEYDFSPYDNMTSGHYGIKAKADRNTLDKFIKAVGQEIMTGEYPALETAKISGLNSY